MAQRSLVHRLWYEFSKFWIHVGLLVMFRVRYSGTNNVPKEGAVLVIANHQSYLDPPLIGAGFPRMMNYLARASLFRFKPFAWLIHSYNAIPVDRERSPLGGIKETLRRLKQGEVVLIFPEGARTLDGEIAPFLAGFATVAVRSGAAILPAAVEGAFDAWPCHRRFPRPGPVHVHYGPAMLPDEIAQYGDQELVEELERRVRCYHAQLREHPQFAKQRKQK
jgi:1-acyl-sn-glycerol-3-phosphate acyltransferase